MAYALLCNAFVNVGLYQAAAALDANSRWQEMLADNLASSSLPGFKRRELSLAAVQAGLLPTSSQNSAPQSFVIPKASTAINFQQGELKSTGVLTDLAVDGRGFGPPMSHPRTAAKRASSSGDCLSCQWTSSSATAERSSEREHNCGLRSP